MNLPFDDGDSVRSLPVRSRPVRIRRDSSIDAQQGTSRDYSLGRTREEIAWDAGFPLCSGDSDDGDSVANNFDNDADSRLWAHSAPVTGPERGAATLLADEARESCDDWLRQTTKHGDPLPPFPGPGGRRGRMPSPPPPRSRNAWKRSFDRYPPSHRELEHMLDDIFEPAYYRHRVGGGVDTRAARAWWSSALGPTGLDEGGNELCDSGNVNVSHRIGREGRSERQV